MTITERHHCERTRNDLIAAAASAIRTMEMFLANGKPQRWEQSALRISHELFKLFAENSADSAASTRILNDHRNEVGRTKALWDYELCIAALTKFGTPSGFPAVCSKLWKGVAHIRRLAAIGDCCRRR
jgi:hypothetical protein